MAYVAQGGTIALLMLRSEMKFAGIVGLSTYLSLRDEPLLSDTNRATPVFMAHGTGDQVVSASVATAPHQHVLQRSTTADLWVSQCVCRSSTDLEK